jgi:O-antigen ligase
MNDRRAFAAADAIGASLVALTIGAAYLASRQHGGDAWPVVALLLATLGFVVLGRMIGWFHRAVLPAAVVITAIVLASTSTVIDGGPLSGPFGYRNATGAFYVQAAIAALMFAAAVRRWPLRVVGIAAAIPFAVIAAKDSSAAAVSLLALAIAAMAFGGDLLARISVVAVATLFVLVLMATVVLGASYHRGTESVFTRALSERRLMLWNESLRIIRKDPSGVGPGRFQEVAPLAQRDQDARWAHNEFLQQGVELGRAGMALVVLLFLWGFARLWMHPAPGLIVALGAASLAALGIHASVDYVLHFPAIPLIAATLVATAQSVQRRRPRRDHEDPRTESLEGDAHPVWVAGTPSLW